MEFHEKLQELRKSKGLTQEELAEILFVSRTAVSKWESGRGMPNIESLKSISKFFSVTLDDLLSSEEFLVIAEDEQRQLEIHSRDMIYGLLDCSMALLFFLPFFGQKTSGIIQSVSLLALTEVQIYLRSFYYVMIMGITAWGALTLALHNWNCVFWNQNKYRISILIHAMCIFLFTISQQPYAAVFAFAFFMIKVLLLERKNSRLN